MIKQSNKTKQTNHQYITGPRIIKVPDFIRAHSSGVIMLLMESLKPTSINSGNQSVCK